MCDPHKVKQSLFYVSIARRQFAFDCEIRTAITPPTPSFHHVPLALIDVASISIESQYVSLHTLSIYILYVYVCILKYWRI